MSARTNLAADLKVGLDALDEGWDVRAVFKLPDVVSVPTVMMFTTTLSPLPAARPGWRRHESKLWVLVPADGTAGDLDALEAEIEVALSTVLGVIDALSDRLTWTEAERGTLGEAFPGYLITIQHNAREV